MGEQNVDQELVRRVQKGDKKAFDVLVIKYQQRIVKLISRYVRDQDEVLDVAQEAFIKAYRALANFRGESAFYTWLYRIAINTAKNYLVAQGRRPPATDVDAEDALYVDGGMRLSDNDTPEQLVQRDQIERVIFETIDAMPEELRTAITLREMEGLSYEEIAVTMDCPVGTVRSRIFRAREAIETKLKPLLESRG
jgi:RNA polymerase sigma-70 factor (ECF subfamily)